VADQFLEALHSVLLDIVVLDLQERIVFLIGEAFKGIQ
jgi:hypothetical protein